MGNKLSLEIDKSKCLYLERDQDRDSLLNIIAKYCNGSIHKYEYILEMYKKYNVFFEVQSLLNKKNVSSIEVTPNEVIATLKNNGIKFSIDASCRSAIFEILNFDTYESEELQIIMNLLEDNDFFFDIGAHVGWYSVNLANQKKQMQVFSFEPIPSTYALLLKNIAHNKLNNMQAFNFGFSDKSKTADLFYSEVGSAIASEKDIFEVNPSKKVQCQLKTLDEFVKEHPIHRLDFIKCDVEGAEFLVLKGADRAICKFLPMVFLEIVENWCNKFGYNAKTIIQYMSDKGYQMFEMKGETLSEIKSMDVDCISNFNYLFLHKEKHSEKIARYAL